MKILIIGTGFLGRKLLDFFSKEHEVIGTDVHAYGKVRKLDATNKKEVKNFIFEINPEVVIDTVALTSSVACEKNPKLCKKLNYNTAKNIAEVCKIVGSKMIFISSSYVFDGKRGNYREEDKPLATNKYAETKIMAEKEVSKLKDYLILRIDMLYGIDKGRIKFGTTDFNKEIIEVGYPNQKKKPLFIDDLPKIISLLIQKKQKGIFHVGCKEEVIMIDFIRKLSKLENSEKKIKVVDSSAWIVKSPKNPTLDTSKIINLGIRTNSLDEAIIIMNNQLKS